jgi:hypothetical protein
MNPPDGINPFDIEVVTTPLHNGSFDWGCPWDRKLDLRCKALRVQAIELAQRYYEYLKQTPTRRKEVPE